MREIRNCAKNIRRRGCTRGFACIILSLAGGFPLPSLRSFKILIFPAGHFAGIVFLAGALLLSLFCFLKILNFPLTRLPLRGTSQAAGTVFLAGSLLLSLFCFLKILNFPFDALRPRGGPYFLLLQKVGKDRRKGVSPPCESPDQSGVLDAPFGNPQVSLRYPDWPNSSPLRGWSFGAVGESASACALATAAAPPPLRLGLRPLAPHVPQRGKSAGHARMRMVPRSTRLLRQRLRKSPGSSCRVSG